MEGNVSLHRGSKTTLCCNFDIILDIVQHFYEYINFGHHFPLNNVSFDIMSWTFFLHFYLEDLSLTHCSVEENFIVGTCLIDVWPTAVLRKISLLEHVSLMLFAGMTFAHSKDIWAVTWQNQQSDCEPSEDSDQPGHPPSLIRVFAVRMKKAWVLSYPLSTQRRVWSDWADAQADLSLRWVHSHFFGSFLSTINVFQIWCRHE